MANIAVYSLSTQTGVQHDTNSSDSSMPTKQTDRSIGSSDWSSDRQAENLAAINGVSVFYKRWVINRRFVILNSNVDQYVGCHRILIF